MFMHHNGNILALNDNNINNNNIEHCIHKAMNRLHYTRTIGYNTIENHMRQMIGCGSKLAEVHNRNLKIKTIEYNAYPFQIYCCMVCSIDVARQNVVIL